jgi:hypothetical protein
MAEKWSAQTLSIDEGGKRLIALFSEKDVSRGGWYREEIVSAEDYAEYYEHMETMVTTNNGVNVYAPKSFEQIIAAPTPLEPEIIEGVLREARKFVLTAASKAGKTFLLMELGLSLATGGEWLGRKCKKSKVLYLDMELAESSFDDRLLKLAHKMEIPSTSGNFRVLHFRGKTFSDFWEILENTVRQTQFEVVIIDPIYKIFEGNENDAQDSKKFCALLDKICAAGAAVIYAHHFSKGAQGFKSGQDRGSGSGVLMRDCDGSVNLMLLTPSKESAEQFVSKYGEKAVALRAEFGGAREFEQHDPLNIIFKAPCHYVDKDNLLADAKFEETERIARYNSEKSISVRSEKKENNIKKLIRKINFDKEQPGGVKTKAEYAREFKTNPQTITNWLEGTGIVLPDGRKKKAEK